MKEIDLSKFTLAELIELQSALPDIIESAKQNEKAILKEKMVALAAESGFALEELFPSKNQKKRKQIGFVKAKYHNLKNTEQTWSGRGRKPKWASEHLKNGGVLEDLLISPEPSE